MTLLIRKSGQQFLFFSNKNQLKLFHYIIQSIDFGFENFF